MSYAPRDAWNLPSEGTGVGFFDSSNYLSTESEFFLLEDYMLSLWSLCSRFVMYSSSVEESVRLKEDHMKDINSTVVRLPIVCS